MAKGDFHLHSTASDGVRSPTWVVETAAANGVRVLSLTDHDTTAGLAEARAVADRLGVRLIAGMELSVDTEGVDAHLLCYAFDIESRRLQDYLAWMRASRLDRVHRIVAILGEMGAPITAERVFAIAGEATVGRPHIARALMEAGYVTSVQDAFDRYLRNDGPADVPREKLLPQQAVDEVHAAGGVVFVAHPLFLGRDPEAVVRRLAALGADGIETYYKHYSPEQVEAHHALGASLGLAFSGGSDYHGLGNPDDRAIGDIPFPDEAVDAFVAFLDGKATQP